MSQYFNPTRFGRLLRKHTAEHLRSYLMGTAVLAGGLAVVLGGLTYLTHRPLEREMQTILYLFFLLVAGATFTSSVFAVLGDARGAAFALLLPASHLEKYVVAWLYSLPVFLLVYTAVFLGVDALALQMGSHLGSPAHPYQLLDLTGGSRPLTTTLLSYALVHASALWGAIYFKRLHLIKTAFLVFGLLAVVGVLNWQMLKVLLPGSSSALPFGTVWVGAAENRALLSLPDSQQQPLLLLPAALALLLWAAAYARLTEKQI